jgi:hypothetical protein
MEEVKFNSVKEFVNWLIDNEGKVLADGYGRQWKYERYGFQFKDIGTNDVFQDGLHCVHLFGTPIGVLSYACSPNHHIDIKLN